VPLLVLAVIVVVTWRLGAADDEPYVVPPRPSASSDVVDPTGAAQALQDLVAAVSAGDRASAERVAPSDDPDAASRLGDLADAAADTRLTDLALRYIDEEGGPAGDGSWTAVVDVRWAFDGFDDEPTATELQVRFQGRDDGDGVAITSIGGGAHRTPVWMSGPIQVARSGDVLVVAAEGIDLSTYARRARAAVPTVSRVVADWSGRLVVEVPADGAALEAALGAEPGYYSQIAAVTGAGGEVYPGAPIHVYVNPDVFDGLGRAGQQVVLAHEATHVATEAPFSSAPVWLVEGFADYVALRDTTLPLTRTARQAAERVRDEGLPKALPDASEFDTRGPHLGAVYEESWLICETLAARGGDAALVRFYTAVSDGAPVAEALEQELDWTEPDLVDAWIDRLASLPGAAA
jgi:hypothetical protein